MYLLFIYLVVAVLGLRCCVWASSSCSEWGRSLAVVPGLLVVASLTAEQRLWALGLSSCGAQALLPLGMGDLPRPGVAPMSPALVDS